MPRRKRHDTISEYHREEVRRKIGLLRSAIDQTTLRLKLFCPHGEALMDLRIALARAENLIFDRAADYQLPGNSTPAPAPGRD